MPTSLRFLLISVCLGLFGTAAVLWMGVYPESFLAPMRKDIQGLEARVAQARPAGDSQLKLGLAQPAVAPATHEEAH